MQAAIDGLLAAEGAPGAPQPENAAVGVDAQAQALAAHLVSCVCSRILFLKKKVLY